MPSDSRKLRIKRIYEPADKADGTRVLVDRVWPRGMTKERAAVDLWLKEVAPSPALRKWFGHDPQRWPQFQSRYRAELDRNTAAVGQLLDLLMKGKVTLLYAAHDVAHNHAVVLIEYTDELSPRRAGRHGMSAPRVRGRA
jgi:uncharacterized protein YeaO (DUF488 family)